MEDWINLAVRALCPDPAGLASLLAAQDGVVVALGSTADRTTFESTGWRVHVVRFRGHDFVEIEVFGVDSSAVTQARDSLVALLGIRAVDILPWSDAQLAAVITEGERRRGELRERLSDLVLIDGPSGVGKSTLVHALRESLPSDYAFLRRYTSRPVRPGDAATDEYTYITSAEFQQMAAAGQFLESKDFLFDMSYGITWDQVADTLSNPATRRAYGIMNLGNVRFVREFVPEVKRVLITAPLDQLRQRLLARGTHSEEALEERLENARMANEAQGLYDEVVWNEDGRFHESLATLRRIVVTV